MSKVAEYGYALYELAAEDGMEEIIDKELLEISNVFQSNTEFVNLLSNPRISKLERMDIIDQVFQGKIQTYLLSFIKILTDNRNISILPLCYREYQKHYYQNNNILLVTAVSAIELNEEQKQRIINKLEKTMNKAIVLENKVDPSCIGGIRLEYQGHMVDASIQNRLKKLQNNIKNADYSHAEV